MNSVEEIWQHILDIIAQTVTPTSYNTWFSDCSAVAIDDGRLILRTVSDFKKEIILKRFGESIRMALYDIFSADFDIVMLVGDEKSPIELSPRIPTEDYTFDNFIVGPSNKFAHAAAVAVAEKASRTYNPLFIYGNSGLGKTHLLLAICEAMQKKDPTIKVAYLKSDEFTNQLVHAIKTGAAEEFRLKYRNVDLFLVDDVQFIAGKEATQEEFFHTFNNIYENGNQIVFTADRPPMEMMRLEDRLKTRFEGGLIVDISPPDLETRTAIINSKASSLGMVLPPECTDYIATNITSNVRQLEGVVKRLTAYRDILEDTITVDTVKRAIKDVIRIGEYIPTPEIIIEDTAHFFSLEAEELRGQSRFKSTALARQIAMYLIRKLIGMPLKDIGSFFEDRNHSTVLSSIRKVEDMVKQDPEIAATVKDITANIHSRN